MPNFTMFLWEFLLLVSVWNYRRTDCANFSYEGEYGPEHWGDHFPECAGNKQSPINIETENVNKKAFPPFQYAGFENYIERVEAESNSHTLMVSIKSDKKPWITGGPLKAKYEFSQFHFHWGPNNRLGSEHQINGKSYALELHVVMELKKDEESTGYDDATDYAVLAFFGNVPNEESERGLFDIFQHLSVRKQIIELFDILEVAFNQDGRIKPINLADFIALDHLTNVNRDKYFTYNGSLTTPPCSETVTWIIFQGIFLVNNRMLNLLRRLPSSKANGTLTRTFRPIQPLNKRKIYRGSSTSELGNSMCVMATAFFTSVYWHI